MRLTNKYPMELNIEKYVKGNLIGVKVIFLRRLAAYARDNNITFTISSGLRSTELQKNLWERDLNDNGGVPSGRVARPGTSWHESGGAIDLAPVGVVRDLSFKKWLPFPRKQQDLNHWGLMLPLNIADAPKCPEWWHIQPVETSYVLPEERSSFLMSDFSYGLMKGPVVKKGHKGTIVEEIQRALVKVGYHLMIDGDYGIITERAVRALQLRYPHAGKNDGKVGKLTWPIIVEVLGK